MIRNNRFIGGGKLYFTASGGTEVEIGEIQEASLTFSVTTKDAFSKDQVMQKKVDKVVTAIEARIKFTTQITNAHNTAMAMLGESTTESFGIGDTLPDGSIAAEAVDIPVIKAGTKPLIEGQLKFVGDEDGDTKPVLVVFNAVITPTGDIGYIMDDFSKLSFEGEVLETVDGYANEYRMSVA
jgi:hypothetical protein